MRLCNKKCVVSCSDNSIIFYRRKERLLSLNADFKALVSEQQLDLRGVILEKLLKWSSFWNLSTKKLAEVILKGYTVTD